MDPNLSNQCWHGCREAGTILLFYPAGKTFRAEVTDKSLWHTEHTFCKSCLIPVWSKGHTDKQLEISNSSLAFLAKYDFDKSENTNLDISQRITK